MLSIIFFPLCSLRIFPGISGERLAGALRSAWPWGARANPNVFGVRESARKSRPTLSLQTHSSFSKRKKDIMVSLTGLLLKS